MSATDSMLYTLEAWNLYVRDSRVGNSDVFVYKLSDEKWSHLLISLRLTLLLEKQY